MARTILEDFDLVVPIDHLGRSLPQLQCAVGPLYNLGADESQGGRYGWSTESRPTDAARAACNTAPPRTRHEQERLELCHLFVEHNEWDIKLWDWVVDRWARKTAGRCWN